MSTWSSTTTPGFYEWLRTHIGSQDSDDKRAVVSSDGDSSIYQVGISHSNNSTTYRLAELKSFLRFSDKSKVAPALRNEGFAVLLALHHFNNMRELGHPVLEQRITSASDVALCDVKLTMELFDGQLSARTTTRIFSSIINMPKTFLTPPIAAVIGASISSETMPLAVFTGVHNIPQVSASATSTVFDDKEQFPLFGRTTTNTIGEAAVAAQFFHSIGSTHVAVIFGTVRTWPSIISDERVTIFFAIEFSHK